MTLSPLFKKTMDVPQFSIVMAYFNRKPQLTLTLEYFAFSPLASLAEVIIVDDGSDPDHQLDQEFCDSFEPLTLRLFRIEPETKTWINPCIPYNLGLTHARGEWIIIQNPEVCPYSDPTCGLKSKDLLTYLAGADPRLYHVLHVYALPPEMHANYMKDVFSKCQSLETIVKTASKFYRKGQPHSIWYTKRLGKNIFLHFCAAIHKTMLNKVGGFNPHMAQGVDFDDDEFLERVSRVVKPVPIPKPLVGFHLWHPKFIYINATPDKRVVNQNIFENTKTNSLIIKVDTSQYLPKFEDICILETSKTLTA